MNNDSIRNTSATSRFPKVEEMISHVDKGIHSEVIGMVVDYSRLQHYVKNLNELVVVLEGAQQKGVVADKQVAKKEFFNNSAQLSSVAVVAEELSKRKQRKEIQKAFEKHQKRLEDLRSITAPQALTTAAPIFDVPEKSIITQMPFQSAFAYIVLDKYLPAQEEALYALSLELNLAGYAQALFNPVVETIKSFNSAPIFYNFGSYLAQTMGMANFKDGYENVLEKYQEEKNCVATDLNSIENASEYLNSIKRKVNAEPNLTPAQKSELNKICDEYLKSLDVCSNQLKSLLVYLNGLGFIRGASIYDPSYTVIGQEFSYVQIQDLENTVVDGDVNVGTGEISGGLLTVFNKMVSDVQSYGDLAQTQQLMLQLELTAMQQEWTLVAASLKLLNGMYKGLTSSIKG
ncbi:CT620/CT621 family type III secretion system effector [Chlamydiifrater phoenicopteri]|uniref:CT620/CT621 family type III secretion system effector n=1 Tax=Chlamydiifrater phoenicopteri TaxID=2681469 RepID=UPI001BCB7D2C|nr:CT620/CT621 family type III secretion system effector [Chlamydiifrater phoenicopteri]